LLAFGFESALSQCTGNIGENIFLDGDFGSGFANILANDPMIAPGYLYTTAPPPTDGSYCITNNTTSWGSFAVNWANIRDNSSDPLGYMMVVNASHNAGIFYEQTVTGLCDNTLYVFSVDVYNLITSGNVIKPNISFFLDGAQVHTTGDVPENSRWNRYGFTFTTNPGQTVLTLALVNNAPGGVGNDLAIDNIEFRPCGPEALILPTQVANICEDGSPINLNATINGNQYPTPEIQWQESLDGGVTWQNIAGAITNQYAHTKLSAGKYYYRYLLANGMSQLANPKCRVVSNVKVINVVAKFYAQTDTICNGASYPVGTNNYSATGIYLDSLLTIHGCDSIITTNLSVLTEPNIVVDFSIANPSCPNFTDGQIEINSVLNAALPYQIYVDGSIRKTGDIYNIGASSFDYRIVDKFGCFYDSTIVLKDPPKLEAKISGNLKVDLGDRINLSAQFNQVVDRHVWYFKSDSIGNFRTLDFAPTNTNYVVLEGFSKPNGCIARDTVFVEVNPVRKIFIPNSFSPNRDGVNDYFGIFGSIPNVQEIEELIIYNRWGGVIYSQANLSPNREWEGWDGKVNGKYVSSGIYIYTARVRFLDGVVKIYSGDLSLLR